MSGSQSQVRVLNFEDALVAASVAALTIYDMTEALDKGIRIREVASVRKERREEWGVPAG